MAHTIVTTRESRRGGVIVPAGSHIRVRDGYDFAEQHNSAGGRVSRSSRIETTDEEGILTHWRRLHGLDLARDMLRNNPQVRGLAKTLRVSIVGDQGKLCFTREGKWYEDAQDWFNDVWAHRADFLDGSTFREMLQAIVTALVFEGDVVAIFDDGILEGTVHGSGRIVLFDSDQICNLDEAGFAPIAARGFTQTQGVIRDRLGRKCGIVVTSRRGRTEVPLDEALVLSMSPTSRDDECWTHVARKFRSRQMRGAADIIPALQSAIDAYTMLALELKTGLVASSRYAYFKQTPTSEEESEQAHGILSDADDDSVETVDGVKQVTDDAIDDEEEFAQGANLVNWSGGQCDLLPPGMDVGFDPATRPNVHLPEFLDYVSDQVGLPLGLLHALSRGRADSSYTAFRGEMVMSWRSIDDFHQYLEDAFCDWAARHAIRHAVAVGELDPPEDEDWAKAITFVWPTMPSVDEQKEQLALAQALKNGVTNLRDRLGYNWRKHVDQRAEEIAYCHAKGIAHPSEQTPNGAAAPETTNNKE